jgi:hypothetical protein
MTNKHDFTGKSIKCDTWEQMLHLAKLAEEQGYKEIIFSEDRYKNGYKFFEVNSKHKYINLCEPEEDIVINYSMFMIVPLPTEVVEVTRCVDCPFAFTELEFALCLHPKSEVPPYTDRFNTCPLKKASITIKLKHND